ncbi:tryptophan-rich sensory protein [Octadecabacter sp. CECT 8868]|uniref:tryptophan-rich sensory protein n=1 Tax=Octadecabacter algicola TaxID=2909342 RepID=UPI001F26D57A|nr:tryptophan-rich sensory protein [Octadecabacter algicola]MCF2905168.1 tryptophan-rich sensory protein [Octadecabacter algicola]
MMRYLPHVVLIATITFVLSPLASTGFNGFTPDQFPVAQVDPPVQPAGYAFSIWGVIYLWLVIGAAYGLWRKADDNDWQAMRLPLAFSLIIGTFWIAAANAAPILATIMIVLMAASAILALFRAGHQQTWLQVRPVALYAGWLTAASGVGIGVVLGGYAIVSAQTAAILCLSGVLVVALFVQSVRPREWGYPVAVIWALTGVIVQNAPSANWLVIALAAIGIAALTFRAFFSFMKGQRS